MKLCWLGLALFAASLAIRALFPVELVPLPLIESHDMAVLAGVPVLRVNSELRLLDPAGPVKAEVRVNHPLRWHGWWIYAAGEGFVAIRDRYWPLAALGGALALLGALCGVLFSVPRTVRAPADASSAKH